MEYERTKEGLIQAGIAKRLGTVLKQYAKLDIVEDKYEVSLTLAILQNLLTNCIELFNGLSRKEQKENPLTNELNNDFSNWGISIDCITLYTFEHEKITYEKIFRHLRNSLSHPTAFDLNDLYLSTGYITENKTELIEKLIFISSPDVKKSKLKQYSSREKAEDWKNQQGAFPKETMITKKEGKFIFTLNSEPFIRICKVELDPKQLLNLTYSLCIYLSHPLQKDWDGQTFKIPKIAA